MDDNMDSPDDAWEICWDCGTKLTYFESMWGVTCADCWDGINKDIERREEEERINVK